jgi:hypothetical protein
MDVSLGFCIIIFLILFPGLIFRRLYFHDQFSKEFNSNHNLASLLAISVVPGIFLCTFCIFSYHLFVSEVSIAGLIDSFKEINNADYKFSQEENITSLNKKIYENVLPFIGFEYLISIIIGLISGRFIRILGLDVKFKILRFKNYWFYLITGEHTRFKRHKHLSQENKKLLLTKADILIDTNSGTQLYSGIVIDYELKQNDCNTLSKIYLIQAERYKKDKDEKVQRREIPGNLMVVDCSSLVNINFTYVFTDKQVNTKNREVTYVIFTTLILFSIPLFLYQIDHLDINIYKNYFTYSLTHKFLIYLTFAQIIHVINPYRLINSSYIPVSKNFFFAKLIVLLLLVFSLYIFY